MKKIKFLLLIFLSFVSFGVVCNAKMNDGKLYEIFWSNAGVNVFASDETYHSLDYNGWMIVSNNDNYTYYCIEPETYMQNANDAILNTHNIYNGDSSIVSNSRLNTETLEQVKLLAYYGYGYKDNKFDHTNKKWYGITQVMIWRVLRPDVNFVFKESRYGNINSNLFLNEVKELQTLVDNHYKSPSFNNTTITMKKGETVTFEDTNKVLSNYIINNNLFADFKIIDNKLTIYAKEEINETITLEKQQVNNEFMLFKGIGFQDIITRGNVLSPKFSFDLVIEGKDVNIRKIDKDTKEFNKNLIGTIIGLYDKDNNLLKEIEITKEVETINLSYGKYYLKELKSSPLYSKNEKIYEFEVSSLSNDIKIVIENETIKGDLEILKVDYSSNKPLKGVLIEVYKEDGTLISSNKTNDDGKIVLNNLLYGNYYIMEKEPLKYYRLNEEKIYFSVTKDKEVIKKVITNERKEGTLEFLKIDKDSRKVLKDALIEIYFVETNEMIFSEKTNEEGKIILSNIVAGNYYIVEKEAPYSYLLNKEKLYFEILEDNQTVNVVMENEKIEIPNTFKSSNFVYYAYFSFVMIGLFLIKSYYEKNI